MLNDIYGGYEADTKRILSCLSEKGEILSFRKFSQDISTRKKTEEDMRCYLLRFLLDFRGMDNSICGLYTYILCIRVLGMGENAGDLLDFLKKSSLVAPAQNAFFSRFIDAVQTKAEEMDSLVLFKQKPAHISLEKCLYQIYDKDLRNVVLWLEDMELGCDALRKLRGLGMNIVLFDTTYHSPYADAVCLNNTDGIRRLVERLKKEGCTRLGYVGWDDMRVRSVKAREQDFQKMAEKIYDCLKRQNQEESSWKAGLYQVKGRMPEERQ